jgi:hypothetical protein
MSAGKSVRLFLADGTPGGLLTAEIMNWTGHVIAAPRSDLASLLNRSEIKRTGIYILLGDDPDSVGGSVAYIGEGDDVGKRLYHHARSEEQGGKDFWDRAIVLTSKDTNLTKAHARYLESRFITIGQQANRARLTNSTAPTPIALPEADISDMEYFIDQARIILPVLGVNIFRSASAVPKPATNVQQVADVGRSPVFELNLKKEHITATAQEVDGEFTVFAGSTARRTWIGGADHSYTGLRARLEHDGTIRPTGDDRLMEFSREHAFASPSAAAAVVVGRASNGRRVWVAQDTKLTYGDWQAQELERAVQQGPTE